MIWGYPYFRKHPYSVIYPMMRQGFPGKFPLLRHNLLCVREHGLVSQAPQATGVRENGWWRLRSVFQFKFVFGLQIKITIIFLGGKSYVLGIFLVQNKNQPQPWSAYLSGWINWRLLLNEQRCDLSSCCCWWKKSPTTTWDVWNPANNQIFTISTA